MSPPAIELLCQDCGQRDGQEVMAQALMHPAASRKGSLSPPSSLPSWEPSRPQ